MTEGDLFQEFLAEPMQGFLNPEHTNADQKRKIMAALGGSAWPAAVGYGEAPRPARRPAMTFTREDIEASRKFGETNSGPVALAAVVGKTPAEVMQFLPRFEEIGFATEAMIAVALYRMGRQFVWRECPPDRSDLHWPDLGLVRISMDGPCTNDRNCPDTLQHNHWVGSSRAVDGTPVIFDVRKMRLDGWRSLDEWKNEFNQAVTDTSVTETAISWRPVEIIELRS